MKKFLSLFIMHLIQFSLSFRYRVRYKGLENLTKEHLNKSGGVLFLPNHPTVFVDPSLVTIGIYKRFPIRPLVVEYMYYTTGIHWLMKYMNAIPIPAMHHSTNSIKVERSNQALQKVVKGLEERDNFLIYPAGRVKLSNYEMIGGASGIHTLLQAAPNTNIVLVRITGLYGSAFSSGLTGKVPSIFPPLLKGIAAVFKNLLFFTPRRQVTIEYCPAPADFPYGASRIVLNRYLEQWYNRPDGIDPALANKSSPGESLYLVPYSRWSSALPAVVEKKAAAESVSLDSIPKPVQEKVIAKLAEMTEMPKETIQPDKHLASDLGLDSLDASEVLTFLQDSFGVVGVPPSALTTVREVMGIAAKQVVITPEEEQASAGHSKRWEAFAFTGERADICEGKTIPEAFFNQCKRRRKAPAIADARSGVLSYSDMSVRVLLLANEMRKLPGKSVGVLLPASAAATLVILALQLAGKTPVLINWTVGARHVECVVEQSGISKVISAWSFLDRLENVDLRALHDKLFLLEDLGSHIGLIAKAKAFLLSKLPVSQILAQFPGGKASEEDLAVLLFTSGTESLPKGVPLSHKNILTNQREALKKLVARQDDVLLGMLPPFHSFGFTISALAGLLGGFRTVYHPNPMEGPQLAALITRWKATVLCGPPMFIRSILKSSSKEEMESIRLIATGAEKATPEFISLLEQFGKLDTWFEGYGITECSPVLTVSDSGAAKVGVGKPLASTELLICHPETFKPVAVGQEGLILARGPSVFKGYLDPKMSSPFITVDGKEWYRTGDLGSLDAAGNLTISGRLKRFFKIGGEMISLGAIESALLEAAPSQNWVLAEEGPSLAVVVDESQSDKPKLILFTRFQATVEEVNKALRERGMSNLVRVQEVHSLEEIPLMGTGKVHYRELQAKVQAMKEKSSAASVLPLQGKDEPAREPSHRLPIQPINMQSILQDNGERATR